MRKFPLIMISLSLLCLLTACKSKAATNADELITAIGEVTIESGNAIANAEAAVVALSDKDAEQLEFRQTLLDARTQYDELVIFVGEVSEVEEAINALPEANLENIELVEEVRELYDSKPDAIRNAVSNYAVLVDAESAIDQLQIDGVNKLISAIGTVSLESGNAIAAAEQAYQELPEHLKSGVNEKQLKSARTDFKVMAEAALEQALAKLDAEIDKVTESTNYQSNYAVTTSGFRPSILDDSVRGTGAHLMLLWNHSGQDFLMLNSITIKTDTEIYRSSFSADEIHYLPYGWTYYEVGINTPKNDDELKFTLDMMTDMVTSEETVIRFNGTLGNDDITLTSKDKSDIKEVLDAAVLMFDLGILKCFDH